MGKAKKASPGKRVEITEEVVSQVSELKSEGNKLFAKKEYAKAIDTYDKAIKLLPEAANERVDLFSNKAACYYQMKRYKDAAKECTSALVLSPVSPKALQRRAKAYEQLGLYKQALSDVQAINKTELATEETREAEKRLKDVMAGRRPGVSSNGPSNITRASGSRPAQKSPYLPYITAKVSFKNETRLIHMGLNYSYADLKAAVALKFPEAGPVVVKYVDKDGDLVTITQKQDVQNAMMEALAAYEKQSHGPRLASQLSLPPIRIQLNPVGSEAEVPAPPPEEESERQQGLTSAGQRVGQSKTKKDEQPGEMYEIDEWLIDFANLFRDMTGIDPDRHIDLHNEGWENTSKAMEATLQSDAALPLFAKAGERFKEVTCTGLLNWGNVHICIAHKFLDEIAVSGKSLSEVKDKVAAELNLAEEKYREALRFKDDFFDVLCAFGQLEFERAKVAAGLVVKPVRGPPLEEDMDPKAQEKLQQEAAAAASVALKEALAKVEAKDVESAQNYIDAASSWFTKAMEAAPEDKKAETSEASTNGDTQENGVKKTENRVDKPAKAENEISVRGQAQIMFGNILYEWSQMLGAVGKDWQPVLDKAVEKFRAAGCSEPDIKNALRNHTLKDQLDLGPEEEPQEEVVPTEKEEAKTKEAKGLPSLEVKGKKKAAA